MPQCEGLTQSGERCKKLCRDGKTKCNLHEGETCPVCMLIMNQENSRRLDCGHTFHTRCLERWRRRAYTCPMCRAPFDQPSYRVRITVQPMGYENEIVTSNIQSIVDTFGLDMMNVERFFTSINMELMNILDLQNILNNIGFEFPVPIPSGVNFPGPNTES